MVIDVWWYKKGEKRFDCFMVDSWKGDLMFYEKSMMQKEKVELNLEFTWNTKDIKKN